MARSSSRVIRATLVASVLAIAVAGPVGATILPDGGHYAADYEFSFDDCGFWIDGSGHVEGVAHLRVGKGDQASAFFLHDKYAFTETWTNRDTGTWLTISGSRLFQETRAIHVGGTLFAFRSVEAGAVFTVRDQDGNLIVRDRGVIRRELIFDTQGDDVPGGVFVDLVSFDIGGPHLGLDFDVCAALS